MNTVRILIGSSGAVDELQELAALVESLDRPSEIVDGLIGLLDGPVDGLVRLDLDRLTAPGTLDLRVGLEPSKGLRDLVATARALEANRGIVEECHRSSSVDG